MVGGEANGWRHPSRPAGSVLWVGGWGRRLDAAATDSSGFEFEADERANSSFSYFLGGLWALDSWRHLVCFSGLLLYATGYTWSFCVAAKYRLHSLLQGLLLLLLLEEWISTALSGCVLKQLSRTSLGDSVTTSSKVFDSAAVVKGARMQRIHSRSAPPLLWLRIIGPSSPRQRRNTSAPVVYDTSSSLQQHNCCCRCRRLMMAQ